MFTIDDAYYCIEDLLSPNHRVIKLDHDILIGYAHVSVRYHLDSCWAICWANVKQHDNFTYVYTLFDLQDWVITTFDL